MKRAATTLILRRNDADELQVLAVSRREDHTAFGLPGGKVDEGEPRMGAAARELKEETGVTAASLEPVFEQQSAGDIDFITTTFLVKSWTGEPSSQPNEGVCKWVDPNVIFAGPFGSYNRKLFKTLGLLDANDE